ncbi:hypothetical protein [Metaclostridioides mangenotii]|uniref:hypothetical protein n=1 Tax=Metaclostridioides mangenotii TaxID=1540 RepID=UPI0012682DFF|nr:hypothetical protein [Clostridioides mangenotii]
MVNENSPMVDIALEAKDTSDDVRQTILAIEASVKHVDNTVVNMPLSGVSDFIDNYPTPKPEVAPGFVGYAVDTSKNEYDITHIYKKQVYPPAQEEFFQYNGNVQLSENWTNIEMFNDSVTIQRNDNKFVFSTPDGVEFKRLTLPYSPSHTFMLHGYDNGYEDLYMIGAEYNSTGSKYRVECYNSQGDLVKTVYFKTKYYFYHGFAFNGEHFYSISRHDSGADRYLDKYNADGTYVDSIKLIDTNMEIIEITANYVLCFGLTIRTKCFVYTKELTFVIDIPTGVTTSGNNYNKSISLFGFDHVYIRFTNYVLLIDLVNKTSKTVQSGVSGTLISYFGSYCLVMLNTYFYKFDHNGDKFHITKPKAPTDFFGLSSNGSMTMGVRGTGGYSYTDLADKELTCLAKKRG